MKRLAHADGEAVAYDGAVVSVECGDQRVRLLEREGHKVEAADADGGEGARHHRVARRDRARGRRHPSAQKIIGSYHACAMIRRFRA